MVDPFHVACKHSFPWRGGSVQEHLELVPLEAPFSFIAFPEGTGFLGAGLGEP